MKIKFSPNNYQPEGLMSFMSWENPDLQAAIRKAFRESPRERMVEIIIERDGIKVRFEVEP